MAYAFVNTVQATTGAVAATTIASPSISLTSGNLGVALFYYNAATGHGMSVADNQGNTWTQIGTEQNPGGGQDRWGIFATIIATTAATVVTGTIGAAASENFRSIRVDQYSGISSKTPDVSAFGTSNAPGAGSNAITLSATNTQQPALMYAAILNLSNAVAGTAGTGFTSQGSMWNFGGATDGAWVEDKRLTTTGSQSATATVGGGEGASNYGIITAVFVESGGGGGGAPNQGATLTSGTFQSMSFRGR